ncbi:CBS domain-containing protein [Weizmannia acidilactici]|uniref:CBS domain-containing protein n=1 Tax=Weizmannia acidilactici TaxID=2607726 RepID=A0A5J4JPF9_9BACI|nr:CBS domain-containing protein [Weizmannia acidilactici]GER68071.1 CBS domain-containing protein [Weizmannia acidilactici]GER70914.1 CBS domain-containing protein [Weizmannia acidilactici]GER73971.1 CBS domain-containing protein [Weizmannia acidilactici]
MEVRDFMIRDVITVKKETTIRELLKVLVDHKIGGVPVVDGQGKLLGMISDGDVIRFLQPKARTVYDFYITIVVNEREDFNEKLAQSLDLPVEKIMKRRELYTVKPDDDFENALSILAKHHFKKLPVVNPAGRVVGVISRGDIMRQITTKLINS